MKECLCLITSESQKEVNHFMAFIHLFYVLQNAYMVQRIEKEKRNASFA